MAMWHVAFTAPQVIAPLIGGIAAYYFNRALGSGFGYRVVMFMVIVYLLAGAAMVRPIRSGLPGRRLP